MSFPRRSTKIQPGTMRRIFPFVVIPWLTAAVFGGTAFPQIVAVTARSSGQQTPDDRAALAPPLDLPKADSFIDPVDGFTVEHLTELAVTGSPALEAARQEVKRAEGELRQAGARPNPTFDFERTRNPVSAPENSYQFGASYPFEVGGKRRRRIEVATVEMDLARKRLADAERTLRAEIKSAFGEFVAAVQTLRAAEETSEINRELFKIIDGRFREGDASGLERSLLAVELNRLDADRLTAFEKVSEGTARLRELARLNDDQPIRIRGTLDLASPPVAGNGLLTLALAERPDVQGARLYERKTEAALRLQQANAIPNVTGTVRYTLDNTFFDDIYGFNAIAGGRLVNVRDNDKLLTVGVSVELPFFNRNRGNISAASADIARARAERERLERAVTREVRVALARYETATRTLTVLTRYVQPGAEMNLRTIRAAYQAGQFRLLDVINEQRKLIETQAAIRAAQLAVFQARVELERAVGAPLP